MVGDEGGRPPYWSAARLITLYDRHRRYIRGRLTRDNVDLDALADAGAYRWFDAVYTVVVDMALGGTLRFLEGWTDKQTGETRRGFDDILSETPLELLGRDGATLVGFDPETWGMDVSHVEFPPPADGNP